MALCAEGTTPVHLIQDTNPIHAHAEGSTQDLESFLTILKGGTSFRSNNGMTLARQCANLLWKTPHQPPSLVRLLEHTNLKIIHRGSSDIVLISDLEETFLCPISLETQKDAPSFANSREMLECLSKHEYVAFKAMESVGVRWAPFVMDMIQLHLDSSGKVFSAQLRNACIQSLVYLNKRYNILPQSIYLEDVSKEGSHPISGGGFSDIWRGRLNKTQDVCLKVLRVFTASYNKAKLIKELSNEVLIWRQLRHPHILEFLGITSELFKLSFCIVSPWMSNGTVVSYSLARGCSLQCKVDMLSTVALAMQYLHEHCPPVIHGDIKGANILVSEDEKCYLGDFGLSTFENNTENQIYRSTSRAEGRGSVPWLAPELINPDDIGAESRATRDIYAFGCTIFELITGTVPFSEKRFDVQIMTDVLKGARPKRPSVASCPDWLWDLVEACWAEDVSTRPTARQVVSRLSRIELPEPFVQEAIPTHVPPLARKRTCGSSSNTITKRPKVKLEREAERQGRAEKKRRNEIMQETDDGGGSKQLRIDNELSPHARGEGASGPIRRDHSLDPDEDFDFDSDIRRPGRIGFATIATPGSSRIHQNPYSTPSQQWLDGTGPWGLPPSSAAFPLAQDNGNPCKQPLMSTIRREQSEPRNTITQRKRGKLPEETTDILKAWLHRHSDHPYPNEEEQEQLCQETGLSITQVSNWMINARRRMLAPGRRSTHPPETILSSSSTARHASLPTHTARHHLHPLSQSMSSLDDGITSNVSIGRTAKASHNRRKQETTFVCPIAGCGSTFTRSFNLKAHLRSHNGPFMCKGCQIPFAGMDALNRHLRSESGSDCFQTNDNSPERVIEISESLTPDSSPSYQNTSVWLDPDLQAAWNEYRTRTLATQLMVMYPTSGLQ